MFVCRVLSRVSRNVCRSYRLLPASQSPQHLPSQGLLSTDNLIPVPVNLLHLTINASSTPRALFFSTSPKPDGKEHGDIGSFTSADSTKASEEEKASVGTESSGQAEAAEQTRSGLGSEMDFSRDGREFVVKNFAEGLLDVADNLRRTSFVGNDKFSSIDASKGLDGAVQLLKTLHGCLVEAEKQIAEVIKKCDEFDPEREPCGPDRDGAILELQNFAKVLVDVADDLGRASLVAKDKFSNIDAFKKSNDALPILKKLLEAVEMTEKQLDEAFEQIGLEKFNSKKEPYNPDRHNAIIQFPVSSQPPGTIIAVLKAGYLLHGHMYRRAEVATTREVTDRDRAEDDLTPGLNDEECESQAQRTG
ncbi:grpE protein homolog 2, mitochondrial [Neltuma alba]|uniref:grpE protein homolog 2, mitochondrial n=1 Tax=Neltuma alba TaxID=207710 RepID=UPI0010A3A2FC|nr:grpE protein homolog 2, mitochondrial-like [Prosopis alba]